MGFWRRWVRRLAPLAVVIAVLCLVAFLLALGSAREFTRGLSRARPRVRANAILAPEGSVVMLGRDTIGIIVSIAGLKLEQNSADWRPVEDSLMIVRAIVRSGAPSFDPATVIGSVTPIRNWTSPVEVALVPKDQYFSAKPVFGRLVLDSPRVELPIVIRDQ